MGILAIPKYFRSWFAPTAIAIFGPGEQTSCTTIRSNHDTWGIVQPQNQGVEAPLNRLCANIDCPSLAGPWLRIHHLTSLLSHRNFDRGAPSRHHEKAMGCSGAPRERRSNQTVTIPLCLILRHSTGGVYRTTQSSQLFPTPRTTSTNSPRHPHHYTRSPHSFHRTNHTHHHYLANNPKNTRNNGLRPHNHIHHLRLQYPLLQALHLRSQEQTLHDLSAMGSPHHSRHRLRQLPCLRRVDRPWSTAESQTSCPN